MKTVLIVGFGYVATVLAEILNDRGYSIYAISRGQYTQLGVKFIQHDIATLNVDDLPSNIDHVIFLASPDARNEESYRQLYQIALPQFIQCLKSSDNTIESFIFVSSTGIYDQTDGHWVDESTPLLLASERSRSLAAAEQTVLESGFNYTVVRFSGIYGPDRHYLLDKLLQGDAHFVDGNVYSNRIHRDDCAGVIDHILHLDDPKPLYLATDDEPTPINEVLSWLCVKTGMKMQSMPHEELALSTDVVVGSNKRCSNRALQATGYVFRFSSYREGFEMILEEKTI